MKKQGNFDRHQKRLNAEAKNAAAAIETLYPREGFLDDLHKLVAQNVESFMGKDGIPDTVRIKLFPDEQEGMVMSAFRQPDERRLAYQALGAGVGEKRKQLVAAFRTMRAEVDKQDSIVVCGMTCDGRSLLYHAPIVTDSEGRIQNYGEPRLLEGPAYADPNLASLMVGYGYAYRDALLRGLVKDVKVPEV